MNVSFTEAKNKLTQLLAAVERGERISIRRHGCVVAQLVQPSFRRAPISGTLKGLVRMTPKQFRQATRPQSLRRSLRGAVELRLLLDTTAVHIAAGVSDSALTPWLQRLLEEPDLVLLLSLTSFLAVAIKANRGLTPLTRQHLETLAYGLSFTVLPITAAHSFGLLGLPPHHHVPFDRAAISIALAKGGPPRCGCRNLDG